MLRTTCPIVCQAKRVHASSAARSEAGLGGPSPLQEFSVVYTDRALNHMSKPFINAMNDISRTLKEAYNAKHAVVIPGSGTYAMEACARQFATGKKTIVIRNGYFSYRWTQIFEACGIPTEHIVLRAEPVNPDVPTHEMQFAPHNVDKVVETIMQEKPGVIFAPHVETSTGMILPDDYIKQVSDAVHSVGGLMVLDCIASGTVWVDMAKTGGERAQHARAPPPPPPQPHNLARLQPSRTGDDPLIMRVNTSLTDCAALCFSSWCPWLRSGCAHFGAPKGLDRTGVRGLGDAERPWRRHHAQLPWVLLRV